MASRAVLIARAAQIVERGRRPAHSCSGRQRVALQAKRFHVGAFQHSRIYRSMRFVASRAAFQIHGSMLKNKRTALVAVTLEAAALVGGEGLERAGQHAAVGIVAIHAAHRALRQLMTIGPGEAGPLAGMASGALRIHRGRGAGDQVSAAVLVDRVAANAAYIILGVTALQARDMGRSVEVAA